MSARTGGGWPIWQRVVVVVLVIFVAAVTAWFVWLRSAHGFSASATPTAPEAFLAELSRTLALPADADSTVSPYHGKMPDLTMAREHFAAHCAVCHNNNGDGLTDFGRNLYPKPPNLRGPGTQDKTDGALFYTISNGVRLSGMPAWPDDSNEEIWLVVAFIRHLPQQTPADVAIMKKYNPTTLYPEPIM